MAYLMWRVFMKKYEKIRHEIQHNSAIIVTPCKPHTNKEEAWNEVKSVVVDGNTNNTTDNNNSNDKNGTNSKILQQQPFESSNNQNDDLNLQYNGSNIPQTLNNNIGGNCGDIDIESGIEKNDLSKIEVRRSKSRVRSYLKKCKDRLTGTNNNNYNNNQNIGNDEATCTFYNQHNESNCTNVNCCQQNEQCANGSCSIKSSTSWYLENIEPPDINYLINKPNKNDKKSSDILIVSNENNTTSENLYHENSVQHTNVKNTLLPLNEFLQMDQQQLQIQEEQQRENSNEISLPLDPGIEELMDSYLGQLYPLYFEHSKIVLVRQARDVLVCTYHGCLKTFENKFLAQTAKIISKLKENHKSGENFVWYKGWPLATTTGDIILHLGTIDESFVRPQDIYICIKPGENLLPNLCAVWRIPPNYKIHYHLINDYDKYSLSPLSLEMLTDELPQLLQNLLVGVERAIGRIQLNELSFPIRSSSPLSGEINNENNLISDDQLLSQQNQKNDNFNDKVNTNNNNNNKNDNFLNNSGMQRCALKRSELITKHTNRNIITNKYMMRRTSYSNKYCNTNTNNNSNSNNSNSNFNNSSGIGSVISNSNNDTTISNTSESASSLATDIIKQQQNQPTAVSTHPLFCLGGSFPHIDSDEENSEERKSSENDNQLPYEIIAPRSILEVPEKLLLSGIHLPGTRDLNGKPLVTVNARKVIEAGLNCYEVATALLYYSTIPEKSSSFTILIMIEEYSHVCVVDLVDNSLKLLPGHFECIEILVTFPQKCLVNKNRAGDEKIKYIEIENLTTKISSYHIPIECGGVHLHNQDIWRNFFIKIDPFQSQCLETGHRLVSAMGDIRSSDLKGFPSRRLLYSQHRALSKALMDPELRYLRKHGSSILAQLQELAKNINNNLIQNNNINNSNSNNINNSNTITKSGINNNNSTKDNTNNQIFENEDITNRLNKVIVLFNEVDRAAKRLEQLTEQRREKLRELTRQRTLEEEMNEVALWIQTDGEETLKKFSKIPLECEDLIKDHEQEFEKYYFISMKHLAKGRDLHEAAIKLDALKENATSIKGSLQDFSERLENTRERIEGAARLHHLLGLQIENEEGHLQNINNDDRVNYNKLHNNNNNNHENYHQHQHDNNHHHHHHNNHNHQQNHYNNSQNNLPNKNNSINIHNNQFNQEIKKLIEKIGVPGLLEKYRTKMNTSENLFETTSTKYHLPNINEMCHCWREGFLSTTTATSSTITSLQTAAAASSTLITAHNNNSINNKNEHEHDEDEEDHSKIADSGLGECDRCCEDNGNIKLSRVCSCQSFDESGNLYDKSHNSDELEEDCFENNSKQFLDSQSPIEPNTHLQCHASSLDLQHAEELNGLDSKIQKTLLLIIREMIGTERDYVRSLNYVIENYMDELHRDDIPQPLRGQRNVIFGNIEKIFEFHQRHFLTELEKYENNPLKVGAAFLQHESKFYLYALYNKNKPKSDTLMSEYGTTFFKSKQIELADKMDLASYLLKPVQRMGKYALLLQQLVKACSGVEGSAFQEITNDVDELQRAEEMVKFQLRHGNDLLAMDSLRECDVNVKEQGRLLRQNEFLVWQGRGGKKSLRQVFLFEELVLFSKARRFPDHKNLDIYIYKHSIKTSDIGLTAHVGDSPTKFEIWFRKRKPEDTWTLQSMSEDIKNAWTEEISKLLWKQAKRNREIRLAEMSSMGIGNKPCLDIRPSHNQINDRSITISQLGKAPKFRNSFAGTLTETKSSRRPNSLISESSMSSGTSSTSTGSSSGSRSGNGLELINETSPLGPVVTNSINTNNKKHQRSTTLISQLSIESGIMSDISMTPDGETQELLWPNNPRKTINLTLNSKQQIHSHNDLNLTEEDPYITNDSVTVHL